MADTKISALPAAAGVTADDLFPMVNDPAGTPETQKATAAQFRTYLEGALTLNASAITAGALAVARGGTGLASYTVGDLIYADGATSLAKLADVATGNALIAGGVGVAPSWGKIGLTTHVSGILPSANGGTGVNNAGTLTNASNTAITGGGTLALGGFTLTVPATGSAVLLGVANVFSAAQAIAVADAGTNTTTTLATLTHNSSGTPAASFGSRLLWNLDSATVDDRNAFALDVIWTTATDASRSSAMIFSAVSAAGALTEMFRVGPATVTVPALNGITIGSAGSAILSVVSNILRVQATSGVGIAFYGDNTERSRMLSTGLWGFGMVAPTTQVHVAPSDAVTNAVTNVLTVGHNSSGTPAAGFGVGVLTHLQSNTTANTVAADELTTWVVATHASRTARRVFNIYDTASREALRMEASGSAPMLGFLGANAVVRQTLSAAASDPGTTQTLANDLRTALINLGLAA